MSFHKVWGIVLLCLCFVLMVLVFLGGPDGYKEKMYCRDYGYDWANSRGECWDRFRACRVNDAGVKKCITYVDRVDIDEVA